MPYTSRTLSELAGASHRAAGTPVVFSVELRGTEIQSDANVHGVLDAIAHELLESMQFDGVNHDDYVFTVRMRPVVV